MYLKLKSGKENLKDNYEPKKNLIKENYEPKKKDNINMIIFLIVVLIIIILLFCIFKKK
jgi:hypothetical protein